VALVAYNRRDELEANLGQSNYDISHLCHNGNCFNPEHLIVESSTNNLRRRICNGQKVLVHSEFSYHPCPHGRIEKLRKCILPLHYLEDNAPNANGGEQKPAPAYIYPDPDDTPTLDLGRVRSTLKSHGVRPFLHQLAVIATNRGDEL
ncbi:zinc-binding loop region of homing endonuclease-domain-containing protein, partial [Lipomyces starkeyi]